MTTARPVSAPSPRVDGLGRGLVVTAALAAAIAGTAAVVAGAPQVLGALVGAAVVAGFFALGSVVTAAAAAYAPGLSLLVALTTYALQVALLAVVFLALTGSPAARDAVDVEWAAGTVIAGTLLWTATLVHTALRSRHPVYDLPASGAARAAGGQVSGEVRG